jgi:hypothetical protein
MVHIFLKSAFFESCRLKDVNMKWERPDFKNILKIRISFLALLRIPHKFSQNFPTDS